MGCIINVNIVVRSSSTVTDTLLRLQILFSQISQSQQSPTIMLPLCHTSREHFLLAHILVLQRWLQLPNRTEARAGQRGQCSQTSAVETVPPGGHRAYQRALLHQWDRRWGRRQWGNFGSPWRGVLGKEAGRRGAGDGAGGLRASLWCWGAGGAAPGAAGHPLHADRGVASQWRRPDHGVGSPSILLRVFLTPLWGRGPSRLHVTDVLVQQGQQRLCLGLPELVLEGERLDGQRIRTLVLAVADYSWGRVRRAGEATFREAKKQLTQATVSLQVIKAFLF